METLEARMVLTGDSPLHNLAMAGDVNRDLVVSKHDAFAIINLLHAENVPSITVVPLATLPNNLKPDVTNDWLINSADVDAIFSILGGDPNGEIAAAWTSGGGTPPVPPSVPPLVPPPAPPPGGTPNSPPLAAGDLFSTRHDVPLASPASVLANDSDPNNNLLTAVLETGPSHAASFVLNSNGTFSYTPESNWAGSDSFTYHASDGQASSNSATVSISVTNTVPGAFADAFTRDQVQTLSPQVSVLDNDNDFEGDSLTAVLTSGPAHAASFTLAANGRISYVPQAGWSGTDSFSYVASDGISQSAPATVTISAPASTPAQPQIVATGFSYPTLPTAARLHATGFEFTWQMTFNPAAASVMLHQIVETTIQGFDASGALVHTLTSTIRDVMPLTWAENPVPTVKDTQSMIHYQMTLKNWCENDGVTRIVFSRRGDLRLVEASGIEIVSGGVARAYNPATDMQGMVFKVIRIDGVIDDEGSLAIPPGGDPTLAPVSGANIGDSVRFIGEARYRAVWEEKVTTTFAWSFNFGWVPTYTKNGTIDWATNSSGGAVGAVGVPVFPEKAVRDGPPPFIDISTTSSASLP